ncbi:MAG: hypothetical protein AB1896_23715 [Thermodesulfobacteriota bacterium]
MNPRPAAPPPIEPDRAAFDIDGVVVDIVTPFLRLIEERHGYRGFTARDVTDFDLELALGLPAAVVDDVVDLLVDSPLEAGVRPYPGAARVLAGLACRGSLLFVTARHRADRTRQWLEAILPELPPDRFEVIATGDPLAKLGYLLEKNRPHFFDDHLETCRQLARAGLFPYVFDQPWNRRDGNLPRVSGWAEVGRLFGLDVIP